MSIPQTQSPAIDPPLPLDVEPQPAPSQPTGLIPDMLPAPSEVTGLIRVPLPPDGLPLWSLTAALEEIASSLPLDDTGKSALQQAITALGVEGVPSLPVEGLVLMELSFAGGQARALYIGLAWPDADWELFPGFTIGAPSLAFAMAGGAWELTVGGELGFGPLALAGSVTLPELQLEADLVHAASLGDLLTELHLDGSSLDDLDLTRLSLTASVRDRTLSFAVAVAGDWHPFGSNQGPALRSLSFQIDWDRTAGRADGSFTGELEAGGFLFDASAAYAAAGWDIAASLREAEPSGTLSLQRFADAILGPDSPKLPLDGRLVDAGITLSTASGAFTAHCRVQLGEADGGAELDLRLRVDRDASGAREVHVEGSLIAAGLEFDLVYDHGSFLAVFSDVTGHRIHLVTLCNDLLRASGATQHDLPLPPVELQVREVLFVVLPPPKHGGESAPPDDGHAPTAKPKRRALLYVDLDLGFQVGALPLVGDVFGHDFELKLRFAPRYASENMLESDIGAINALLPAAAAPLPVQAISEGADFAAEVTLGRLSFQTPVGMGLSRAATDGPPASLSAADAVQPSAAAGQTSWIEVHRTIGPLNLARIGLGFEGKELSLLLDGGVAFGPIAVAASGLGVDFDLGSKTLTPELAGLTVDFHSGNVSIAGGFLRTKATADDRARGLGDTYAGLVRIVLTELQLSAMGLYQEVNGGPTIFIYGVAGFSAGLPPLISIEGVALGFGYGRRLIDVPAAEVQSFPLVQEVLRPTSNDVLKELASLAHYLPPSPGGLVFALGVKVGILEMIDGFVLATVTIAGGDLDIQLFGAATATVPPKMPPGEPIVARIEIDVVARIRPSRGELQIEAQLGSGSFVLSSDCHLTGGLAFYSWLAGEHRGDFVLTLGGYPASYRRPVHYPVVPRLALDWQVTPQLSVHGELYGALVPSAFYSGGLLAAHFAAGRLEASFRLALDLELQWKPFHYNFEATVDLAARYGSFSISVHADLHVWGPDFSGRAEVSVFLVSFAVEFGDSQPDGGALSWEDFRTSFLPQADHLVCVPALTAGVLDVLEGDRASHLTDAQKGSDGKHWIVSARDLEIRVSSAVPWLGRGAELSVKPMGGTRVTCKEPEVTITRLAKVDGQRNVVVTDDFRPRDANAVALPFRADLRKFPTALWSDGSPKELVELNGALSIRPNQPAQACQSHPIPRQSLEFTETPIQVTESTGDFLRASAVTSKPSLEEISGQIEATLGDSTKTARRLALLEALGFDPRELGILDRWAATGLAAAPRLGRRTE